MAKDFVYPVAVRALEKWKNNNLDRVGHANGTAHFRFLFNGSTCNNGGTPFKAYLHVELDIARSGGSDPMVNRAWIEIPEDQLDGAQEMCGVRNGGDAFLESLSEFPKLQGRSITDILSEDVPLNHAGCFCTEPMTNQKWRMALSAIHYTMNSGE